MDTALAVAAAADADAEESGGDAFGIANGGKWMSVVDSRDVRAHGGSQADREDELSKLLQIARREAGFVLAARDAEAEAEGGEGEGNGEGNGSAYAYSAVGNDGPNDNFNLSSSSSASASTRFARTPYTEHSHPHSIATDNFSASLSTYDDDCSQCRLDRQQAAWERERERELERERGDTGPATPSTSLSLCSVAEAEAEAEANNADVESHARPQTSQWRQAMEGAHAQVRASIMRTLLDRMTSETDSMLRGVDEAVVQAQTPQTKTKKNEKGEADADGEGEDAASASDANMDADAELDADADAAWNAFPVFSPALARAERCTIQVPPSGSEAARTPSSSLSLSLKSAAFATADACTKDEALAAIVSKFDVATHVFFLWVCCVTEGVKMRRKDDEAWAAAKMQTTTVWSRRLLIQLERWRGVAARSRAFAEKEKVRLLRQVMLPAATKLASSLGIGLPAESLSRTDEDAFEALFGALVRANLDARNHSAVAGSRSRAAGSRAGARRNEDDADGSGDDDEYLAVVAPDPSALLEQARERMAISEQRADAQLAYVKALRNVSSPSQDGTALQAAGDVEQRLAALQAASKRWVELRDLHSKQYVEHVPGTDAQNADRIPDALEPPSVHLSDPSVFVFGGGQEEKETARTPDATKVAAAPRDLVVRVRTKPSATADVPAAVFAAATKTSQQSAEAFADAIAELSTLRTRMRSLVRTTLEDYLARLQDWMFDELLADGRTLETQEQVALSALDAEFAAAIKALDERSQKVSEQVLGALELRLSGSLQDVLDASNMLRARICDSSVRVHTVLWSAAQASLKDTKQAFQNSVRRAKVGEGV